MDNMGGQKCKKTRNLPYDLYNSCVFLQKMDNMEG